MAMFRRLRMWAGSLTGAVERLNGLLEAVLEVLQERGTTDVPTHLVDAISSLQARADGIEQRQAVWEAEVEAVMHRATEERKRARAAEERARAKLQKLGTDVEDGDEDSLEELRRLGQELRSHDGEGGQEEGMRAVPPGLGDHRQAGKRLANRLKFGLGG